MIQIICDLFGVTLEQSNQSYIYLAATALVVVCVGVVIRSLFSFVNNIFK